MLQASLGHIHRGLMISTFQFEASKIELYHIHNGHVWLLLLQEPKTGKKEYLKPGEQNVPTSDHDADLTQPPQEIKEF